MAAYNHNPWQSVYNKEIAETDHVSRQGPVIATHGVNQNGAKPKVQAKNAPGQNNVNK